jgi:pyridoxine/pyridoxamine 5'-phosphate oxidase
MTAAQVIPYADMSQEAWHRLQQAADDPAHPMRLLVAATMDADLKPAARMLVLRGASRTPPRLWFHTDARSGKVHQLRKHPELCAIAYDHRDGVQLRIDGKVAVHVDDRVTDAHWAQTDLTIRYAYATTAPPGEPVSNAAETDPLSLSHRHRMDEGRAELGRAHFAVLEVEVATIEWFQSTTSLQCRAIMRAANDWQAQPLTP